MIDMLKMILYYICDSILCKCIFIRLQSWVWVCLLYVSL